MNLRIFFFSILFIIAINSIGIYHFFRPKRYDLSIFDNINDNIYNKDNICLQSLTDLNSQLNYQRHFIHSDYINLLPCVLDLNYNFESNFHVIIIGSTSSVGISLMKMLRDSKIEYVEVRNRIHFNMLRDPIWEIFDQMQNNILIFDFQHIYDDYATKKLNLYGNKRKIPIVRLVSSFLDDNFSYQIQVPMVFGPNYQRITDCVNTFYFDCMINQTQKNYNCSDSTQYVFSYDVARYLFKNLGLFRNKKFSKIATPKLPYYSSKEILAHISKKYPQCKYESNEERNDDNKKEMDDKQQQKNNQKDQQQNEQQQKDQQQKEQQQKDQMQKYQQQNEQQPKDQMQKDQQQKDQQQKDQQQKDQQQKDQQQKDQQQKDQQQKDQQQKDQQQKDQQQKDQQQKDQQQKDQQQKDQQQKDQQQKDQQQKDQQQKDQQQKDQQQKDQQQKDQQQKDQQQKDQQQKDQQQKDQQQKEQQQKDQMQKDQQQNQQQKDQQQKDQLQKDQLQKDQKPSQKNDHKHKAHQHNQTTIQHPHSKPHKLQKNHSKNISHPQPPNPHHPNVQQQNLQSHSTQLKTQTINQQQQQRHIHHSKAENDSESTSITTNDDQDLNNSPTLLEKRFIKNESQLIYSFLQTDASFRSIIPDPSSPYVSHVTTISDLPRVVSYHQIIMNTVSQILPQFPLISVEFITVYTSRKNVKFSELYEIPPNLAKYHVEVNIPSKLLKEIGKRIKSKTFPEYVLRNIGARRARGTYIICGSSDVLMPPAFFISAEQLLFSPLTIIRSVRENVMPVEVPRVLKDFNKYFYSITYWAHTDIGVNQMKLSLLSDACGDFQGCHRLMWEVINGYVESNLIFNVDSAFEFDLCRLMAPIMIRFFPAEKHLIHTKISTQTAHLHLLDLYNRFAVYNGWMSWHVNYRPKWGHGNLGDAL